MIALLQRVNRSWVEIDGERVGEIGKGICALLCAERDDTEAVAQRLIDRVLRYRMLADDDGRMNRSLLDHRAAVAANDVKRDAAGLLLVPQFTLAADTRSGLRPSFTPAASPEVAQRLFEGAVAYARAQVADVQEGRFGADMQVGILNDGPVTFWLRLP